MRAGHGKAIHGGERADHGRVDRRSAEHIGHRHGVEPDADDLQRRIAPDHLLGAGIAKLDAQRCHAVALIGRVERGVERDQRQPFPVQQLEDQRLDIGHVGLRCPPFAALATIG